MKLLLVVVMVALLVVVMLLLLVISFPRAAPAAASSSDGGAVSRLRPLAAIVPNDCNEPLVTAGNRCCSYGRLYWSVA